MTDDWVAVLVREAERYIWVQSGRYALDLEAARQRAEGAWRDAGMG